MQFTTIRNIFCVIVLCLCFSFSVKAQQEAQFTQYMFNRLSFNPAYAGSSGAISATGLYHNSWMGFQMDKDVNGNTPATPQNFLLSVDAPVKFLHGGLGGTIFTDKIGYTNSINLKLDYAYRFYLGPGNFAVGVEGEFFNSTKDYSKYIGANALTGDINNPISDNSSDPALQQQGESSAFVIDLGAGFYYQIPGMLYVGISGLNLMESKSEEINWQNKRLFAFTGGFEYVVPSMPSVKFIPSFLLKTNLSSTQFDLTAIAEYQRRFWVGLNYRIEDAVSVLAGLYWNDFKLGVSYDITTSSMGYMKSGRSKGGVEVFLKYGFRITTPPRKPSPYGGGSRYFQ